MVNGAVNSSMRDLRNDLQAVARDAEALLKATAGATGERIDEIRARTQETVQRAYDHLYDSRKQARRIMRQADTYVRDNSWAAVGIAVGVGLLVGLLLRSDD